MLVKLKIWFLQNDITQVELCERCGFSQYYMSRVMKLRKKPSKKFCRMIELETKGEVTAEYLLSFPYKTEE